MGNANWWLIALAFVLGLVLTFALMIRRIKREVPVSSSAHGRSGAEPEPSTKTVGPEDAGTADTTGEGSG